MRRVLSLLLAGAALLAPACGDDDSPAEALAERINDEAPPGFRAASADDGFPLGPFDLQGFLETYSTNEEDDRKLLQEHGFAGGYTRTWIAEASGTVATVIGFEFEAAEGAREVADTFNSRALAEGDAAEFEVPGLPGAIGVRATQEAEDGTQHIHTVTLVVGPRLFTAAVVNPSESDDSELAITLARRQGILPSDG